MDAAKEAVSGFLKRGGREDTEVDEIVQPAVTQETVKPTRHEETTTAVDREVHKHHYHTTVQPVTHQERLPEQHISQVAPVQEREYRHDDEDAAKAKLAAEASQFRNISQTEATRETQSQAAAQTGEHIHHHVHEVVQPVIHKTTHQPEVVHTTIPVHEKIHAPSEHHGLSVLPERTLQDFTGAGGSMEGSGSRQHHEEYEGHPRPYNPQLQQERAPVDLEPDRHMGQHDTASTGHPPIGSDSTGYGTTGGLGSSTSGPHSSNLANKADPRVDSDRDGSRTAGGGLGGTSTGPHDSNLANRADPRVDSDRDGSRTLGGTAAGVGAGAAAAGATGVGSSSLGHHGSNVAGGTGGSGADIRHGDTTGASTSRDSGLGLGSSTAGPHSSDLANKADPRVDSDRDGGRNTGGISAAGGTGLGSGTGSGAGTDRGLDSGTGSGLAGAAAGAGAGAAAGTAAGTAASGHHSGTGTDTGAGSGVGHSDTTDGRGHTGTTSGDDVQSPKQGRDPAVQGDDHPKLTGTGVDGSHSAVFGLTPDGHRHDETANATSDTTGPLRGAHSGKSISDGQEGAQGDTGSRAATGGGIAQQLNDPRVNEPAHGGQASYGKMDPGDKPGSGSTFTNTPQGSGDVRPGEHGTSAATTDKMNPRTDADGDGKAGVMD